MLFLRLSPLRVGEGRMQKRIVTSIVFVWLLIGLLGFTFIIQPVKALKVKWTVDDDGPANFHTIQEAINAANDGDTIFVYNGTYYENIVVNKTVSVIGENIGTTIIDGNGTGNVVLVEGVDDVTMTGVTVRNGSNGFYIVGLNHTVIRNIILNNTYHGIDIVGRNNQISENTIANNRYAIVLDASSYNIISRNTIMSNQGGINLCEDCEYNEISKNTLMNNTMGIGILGNNNSVVENTIKENWSGIQIAGTNNTIYYNNFINNTNQVYLEYSLPNSWDNSYPSGGNYWSNYTGNDTYSGPYQNETGSDGIGDTPYVIDADNQDNYPLMEPWDVVSGNLQILKPANGSVIVGSVNVTFTIENTGCNMEFAKGDSANRIDLEIEYALNQTHGWGIKFWSTSDHGLNLSSGEKYAQTIIYDPSEYEEAVPPDFIGDAPYGETTIRLVHWKQIDTGYSYGEFGMTEINVTLQPIDTTPPTMTLLSPENKTYTTTSVPLIFTANETTSWIGYSLGNQANVTITGNTTLTGLPEGTHSITVYANDTTGNMGASEIVYFTVALPYGPTAEFTVTPETADVGESVKFDASASLPGWNGTHGMPITEYRWDFGGSIKITTSTPIVYYSFISPGIYYVTLTTYAPGATPEMDSTTHKVTVISAPVGGYSVPIKGYTTEKPFTLYLALIAILTASFTIVKRRKKQQN